MNIYNIYTKSASVKHNTDCSLQIYVHTHSKTNLWYGRVLLNVQSQTLQVLTETKLRDHYVLNVFRAQIITKVQKDRKQK